MTNLSEHEATARRAIAFMREALALLDTIDTGVAACHLQHAVDVTEEEVEAWAGSHPAQTIDRRTDARKP